MTYVSQTQAANDTHFDKTFTNEIEGNQSGTTILTPTSGTALAIKGIYVNVDGGGAAGSTVRLYFSDDENNQVNTVYFTKIFAANSGWLTGYIPMLIKGDKDAPLKMDATVGAGIDIYVMVNYREE